MKQQKLLMRKRYKNFWGVSGEKEKNTGNMRNGLKISRGIEYKEEQEKVEITPEKIKKILRKMPSLKASCPDFVQGFWLKNFKSIQEELGRNL